MDDSHKKQFLVALSTLKEVLGGKPLTNAAIRGYWIALRDLSLESFQYACERVMSECKFFPKPAEIRAFSDDSLELAVERAWSQLLEGLRVFGQVHRVKFEDSVLSATIKQMGGLRTLSQTKREDLCSFGKHRFKETYLTLRSSKSLCPTAFKTCKRIPVVDGQPLYEERVALIGKGDLKYISGESDDSKRERLSRFVS